MKMPNFTYHRPETVGEALGLLAAHDPDGKVLAGGQSMLPLMALRLSQPEHLIDIGRLDDLGHLRSDNGSLAIGALVRHASVEDSALVAAEAPLVAAAMPHVGHRAIRNHGTVCGSLAHADPAAEMPAVALALDATFVAESVRGRREIPAAEFFEGYLTTALAADELLLEVRFPVWPQLAGASVTELSRRHGDYALVGLAATIVLGDDGAVASAALAFFGAAGVPVRVSEAEQALIGERPEASVFAAAAAIVSETLDPPDDNHASAAYRRHVAGVLTQRGLAHAAGQIGAAA